MEISCSFIFWLFVFVCHEDKNSAKYYFPTPEEKRKARIDVILMQIEQSHSWDFMSRSLEDAQWNLHKSIAQTPHEHMFRNLSVHWM